MARSKRKIKASGMRMSDFRSKVSKLGVQVATEVAQRGARALNAFAQQDYDNGVTVYGDKRPLGVNGNEITLYREGRLRGQYGFTANGTIMRSVLSVDYAKYAIGRFKILPPGNAEIPFRWRRVLEDIMDQVKSASRLKRAA